MGCLSKRRSCYPLGSFPKDGVWIWVGGSRLLSWLKHAQLVQILSYSTIVLAVAEGNEAAQSLYNALGFVRVGRREIYYGSGARNRIAADIMRFGLHT